MHPQPSTHTYTYLRVLVFEGLVAPLRPGVCHQRTIFIELMTSDHKPNASREGSKLRIYRT